MGCGEAVGTRALVKTAQTRDFCESNTKQGVTTQQGFTAEQFKDLKASEVDALLQQVDVLTAKYLISKYKLEHADLFCLVRDLRYGMRSRRWLFSKAQQNRLNSAFFSWFLFENKNKDQEKIVDQLIPMDQGALKQVPFTSAVTI